LYFVLSWDCVNINEIHILDDDNVGTIGVKKTNKIHKRQRNDVDFTGFVFRIDKVLSVESMHNVSPSICCILNCCQHFPHEKTLLLRQKFWSLSFKDHKTYGLNIPRRLHMKGDGR
jgi:hypothetical protein